MSFLNRVQEVVADAKMSIYIGWYADKDPEFGQQLEAAKPSAALWKLKGTSADLAKAAQHVDKEYKGKGVVLSFPQGMDVVDAKKQVIKAVNALILKKGLKPVQQLWPKQEGKAESSVVVGSYEKFVEVYEKNLRQALKDKPEDYSWPESELPKVLERMKNAIKKGSFNKDSHAFKKTCKELGIKHTYADIKNYIEQVDKVEAGWSYATSELILSLIEKNHSKPFNIDTIHKLQNVWLDVKSKDGEGAVAPQITGHKSSGILTRAEEMKGHKREIVVTLSVPRGYQAEYTKAIQKALPEFKVEKLAKYREPKVVEKTSAKASYTQKVAKVKAESAEYDISFELTTENRGSLKKDVSKEFHKAIESALKAQSLKLTNAIHCGHNHCYTETKDALDSKAVFNHLKNVLDLSSFAGDVYLLIRETELSGDTEKDAGLPGQETILFEPIKTTGI